MSVVLTSNFLLLQIQFKNFVYIITYVSFILVNVLSRQFYSCLFSFFDKKMTYFKDNESFLFFENICFSFNFKGRSMDF